MVINEIQKSLTLSLWVREECVTVCVCICVCVCDREIKSKQDGDKRNEKFSVK